MLVVTALPATAADTDRPLLLGTTTSVDNSGLLGPLLAAFRAETGIAVRTVVRGTGAILQLGRSGDCDVVLVHHPDAETAFVAGGNGITFGDGLRCAGFEAVRLEVTVSDASGAVSSSVGLSSAGAASIADGETVNYQAWYRDDVNSSPCGNSFNTTNAYSIVWGA